MLENATLIADHFERDGYYFPIEVINEAAALRYRNQLEEIETETLSKGLDRTIWSTNANFVLPFVDEISRLPALLDPVKAVLGEDLLVWNSSFFIKEPESPDFVSWHQDLRYWGLSEADEVTAWLALSTSTVESGCVRFVPGSHTKNMVEHRDTHADVNMLSRGQELAVEVDEQSAVDVVLRPGQMSLHHGLIFHSSLPNRSADRRIGVAIRYITPDMKQVSGEKPYARLVCGEDRVGNFNLLTPPMGAMLAEDIEKANRNIQIQRKFFQAEV